MRKLSKITESVWGDIRKKSLGQEARGEIGKKVTTCLDIDVIVSTECDPDTVIQYLLDHYVGDDYNMSVVNTRDTKYTPDELVNARKWVAPYTFMIYDGGHGTDLLLDFDTYEELQDKESEILELANKEDYQAICRCVAEKFKQFGDHISYIHPSRSEVINGDKYALGKYSNDYVFRLIDEESTYYWTIDDENQSISAYDKVFIEDIQNTFACIDGQDFLKWSFNNSGGIYIAIPINFDNLINLKDYIEYTEKWFEVK